MSKAIPYLPNGVTERIAHLSGNNLSLARTSKVFNEHVVRKATNMEPSQKIKLQLEVAKDRANMTREDDESDLLTLCKVKPPPLNHIGALKYLPNYTDDLVKCICISIESNNIELFEILNEIRKIQRHPIESFDDMFRLTGYHATKEIFTKLRNIFRVSSDREDVTQKCMEGAYDSRNLDMFEYLWNQQYTSDMYENTRDLVAYFVQSDFDHVKYKQKFNRSLEQDNFIKFFKLFVNEVITKGTDDSIRPDIMTHIIYGSTNLDANSQGMVRSKSYLKHMVEDKKEPITVNYIKTAYGNESRKINLAMIQHLIDLAVSTKTKFTGNITIFENILKEHKSVKIYTSVLTENNITKLKSRGFNIQKDKNYF